MLALIKNTFKHSIIYSLGNIGIKLVGLILIPIYTNPTYLSTDAYGVFALLESLMAIIVGILPFAMGQSLTRWYYEKKTLNSKKELFFRTFILLTLIQALFLSGTLPVSHTISNLIFKTELYSYSVKLTITNAALSILLQQVMHLAKIQQKSMLFSLTNLFRLILSLGLIILFIVKQKKGLNGIWEAQLLSTIITITLLIPYILKNIKFTTKFPELPEMLKYGLPFTLSAVAGIILVFADKYIINSINGLEQTAIYSLGYRISNTIKIIIATSVSFAIAPVRMKMISTPTNLRFFSKNLTYISFIMMIFVLLVSLFSLEGLKLLTKSKIFWDANNIIPILSMSIFFGVLKDFSSESMLIMKNTKKLSLFVFIAGIFNIIMNYLLIPKFDIYGAAISTFLSQLLLWILVFYYSQKLMYIPYELNKIIKIIITGCIILIANFSIIDFSLAFRLGVKILMIALFPLILYWLHFYEEIELKTIKNAYNSWKNPRAIKKNFMQLLNKN